MSSSAPPSASRPALAGAVEDVLASALGRSPHPQVAGGRLGGPAGNARLTGWLGAIVLALSLAQLATLLDVSGLITWHVTIGAVLAPFALAKMTTVTWRMVRYHRGSGGYREAGAPPLLLRTLGPLVVFGTLGLVATGITVTALGPDRGRQPFTTLAGHGISPLTLHQAFFLGWGVVVGLHVLARLVPAWQRTVGRTTTTVPGRTARAGVLALAAGAAVISAAALLTVAAGWRAHPYGATPLRHLHSSHQAAADR